MKEGESYYKKWNKEKQIMNNKSKKPTKGCLNL